MSARLSIADLEGNDPRSRRTGKERRFLCPLCGKNKPCDSSHRSLALNSQSGLWICHRCDEKGLLTDFWTEQPKLTRKSRAHNAVLRAFSLPKKKEIPELGTDSHWRKMWDSSVPLPNSAGVAYLESRGICETLASQSDVRFSKAWYGRPAILFPLYDRKGDITAVNGRCIDGESPKTLTAGPKSQGVFLTPKALSETLLAIVEAPLDALSLWFCGIPSIATCGTSWPDWLPSAVAFKRVLVATDADLRGDDAAGKLSQALDSRGAKSFRLRPFEQKDWNEFLERGDGERLKRRLAVYSKTADDELRVDTSWARFLDGQHDEAEFLAILVADPLIRTVYQARLRRELAEV